MTRVEDGVVMDVYAYDSDDGRITWVHGYRIEAGEKDWVSMRAGEVKPEDTEGLR
jgi:hypothetical protein